MSIFKGLSAFPITPCDATGALIEDDLQQVLERVMHADVQSIGLLGSTGTYAYLSRETRRKATAVTVEKVGGAKPVIVGVGALRTDDAIALAQDAAAEGADGLLLAPVSYTPLLQDEVFAHFAAVSAATDLPLCIYNNPGTTHFTFSDDLLMRLADLPKVQAVKMPLPQDVDDITRLRALLSVDFVMGHSGDWGCAECILAGSQAWFSVIAGYLPDETARLARAAEAGDENLVAHLTSAFAPMWALFQSWGSLRVIYTAAQIEGVTQGVLPRPLMSMPPETHASVIAALASARGRE